MSCRIQLLLHFSRPMSRCAALSLVAVSMLASNVAAEVVQNVTISDINPNQSNYVGSWSRGSGGRVNGLAIDPNNRNVLYAASELGGLYKSTDGGQRWSHLNGHVPPATWDIEVASSNSNPVYATSFFDGRVNSLAGINVSTDGGVTWVHPATTTPPANFCADPSRRDEPSAFGISIDPANSQNIYVGTNCGLAISNSSGVTWNYVDPTPASGASDIWDVVAHHGGIIDICGDDGHRRSTNGGTTWTGPTAFPAVPGGRCSIAVSPDEPHVIFVVSGTTIYESDDGGATWSMPYPYTPAQGRIPFLVTNNRAGAAYDLWFGDVVLFRRSCTTPSPSSPGGAVRCNTATSWVDAQKGSQAIHNDAGDLVFDSQATVDACPRLYSNDGGVFVNSNNTSPGCHNPTWQQPTVTPHALWVWDLDGADQSGVGAEDLYIGTQDNGSYVTTNAPTASPAWSNRNYGDVFDVSANSNRLVYTQLEPWHLLVGDPGMVNLRDINYPGNLLGFQSLDTIDTFGPDDFVLITSIGVYITNDINANPVVWTQLGAASTPTGACAVQATVRSGTPTFFIKSQGCNGDQPGSLWRYTGTATGGIWQQITRGGVSQFGVFAVDPNRPNRILAADLAPATGPQMVMSDDGGTTWQSVPTLDSLMTAGGIFKYRNQRGPTDFTGFNGYPQPTLVAFDPEDPDVIVAAGADSGVFISIDAAHSWKLVTDPINPGKSGVPHIPRVRHAYFDHEPKKGHVNVYLGSQGRGVWRIYSSKSQLAALEGKISFLRIHAPGTKYGAPPDQLDADVIIRLDSDPKTALGFQLRTDQREAVSQGMLNILLDAFNEGNRVRIEYEKEGLRIGQILRVVNVSD